jgi:hypothetical protein
MRETSDARGSAWPEPKTGHSKMILKFLISIDHGIVGLDVSMMMVISEGFPLSSPANTTARVLSLSVRILRMGAAVHANKLLQRAML